ARTAPARARRLARRLTFFEHDLPLSGMSADRAAGDHSGMPPLAVHRGPFRAAQAERLLWRAGFGPRPGEAAALAKLGLDGAVRSLTRPGRERFVGPAP